MYEVKDQNGDILYSNVLWGLASLYFRDWLGAAPDASLAGAGIWDTGTHTWQARFYPED